MSRTNHPVPNQVIVRAVEMPGTHRIVHCQIACRDGKALAYYPTEWADRSAANRLLLSVAQVQADARWSVRNVWSLTR